jgi:hypothetical protein
MPFPLRVSVGVFEALLAKERAALAVPEACGANVRVNGTLCPAAIVRGKETPLSENSTLLRLADETVTLVPLALRLLAWLTLVPVVTLPKSNAVGVRISWPWAVPVPESDTVNVGLEALESTVIPPFALTADCGANTALKVTLAPGLSVSGTFSPPMLNPVPVTVAWEIVTLAPPVFVSESFNIRLLPTWTFAKFKLLGLAASWPGTVPAPVRGIASAGPETKSSPPVVPADCGAKATFNVTLCPAPRVKGNVGPLIENPTPVVWSAERVTFQERAFVSTTGTVDMVPIATWPNDTIEGLAVTDSLLTPEPETPSRRIVLDASLENLIVPPVHPIAVGVKLTLRSTLCPASKTIGRLK